MLLKFNELLDKKFKVTIVEDRKEAMRGCDFVMTTFSPGAMDAFYNDLEIPVKYGVRLPVSMTCGISGISAALRTVPVAYEITREMEEVCPGAVLLNVVNPMTPVTKAFSLPAKTVKVYGFCHEVYALEWYLGKIFGLKKPKGMDIGEYLTSWLPAQGFVYIVAGINHFIWLTEASWNGKDVIPDIYQYALTHKEFPDLHPGAQATNVYLNNGSAKLAMCRQFGYLPIPGDRHLIEFMSSLCNNQNGFGMEYGVLKTTVDSRRLDKVLQQKYIDKIASGEEKVEWNKSGEEMYNLMQAYVDGTEYTTMVNTQNKGQIENLPLGSVVETMVKKEKDGSMTPISAGSLPQPVQTLCALQTTINDMVVEAALNGDRKLLISALSLDPSTGTMDFARIPDMCEELLTANREWLPRFFS